MPSLRTRKRTRPSPSLDTNNRARAKRTKRQKKTIKAASIEPFVSASSIKRYLPVDPPSAVLNVSNGSLNLEPPLSSHPSNSQITHNKLEETSTSGGASLSSFEAYLESLHEGEDIHKSGMDLNQDKRNFEDMSLLTAQTVLLIFQRLNEIGTQIQSLTQEVTKLLQCNVSNINAPARSDPMSLVSLKEKRDLFSSSPKETTPCYPCLIWNPMAVLLNIPFEDAQLWAGKGKIIKSLSQLLKRKFLQSEIRAYHFLPSRNNCRRLFINFTSTTPTLQLLRARPRLEYFNIALSRAFNLEGSKLSFKLKNKTEPLVKKVQPSVFSPPSKHPVDNLPLVPTSRCQHNPVEVPEDGTRSHGEQMELSSLPEYRTVTSSPRPTGSNSMQEHMDRDPILKPDITDLHQGRKSEGLPEPTSPGVPVRPPRPKNGCVLFDSWSTISSAVDLD